jgi:hypothetical protein
MANVYVEPRPKGRPEGSHIDDYVVDIVMFVPPWLMENEDEFRLVLERTLEPEGGPTHEQAILIQPAYDPRGKIDYLLKGMRRREARILGIVTTCSEGEIVGKRVGYTESIGPAARTRYWLREANRAATIAAKFNDKNLQQKAITTSVPSEIVASKFEGKLAGSDAPSQQPKKSKPAWKQFIGNELPPYDIHDYIEVAPILAAQGYRVIVPHLRGHGSTPFSTPLRPAPVKEQWASVSLAGSK